MGTVNFTSYLEDNIGASKAHFLRYLRIQLEKAPSHIDSDGMRWKHLKSEDVTLAIGKSEWWIGNAIKDLEKKGFIKIRRTGYINDTYYKRLNFYTFDYEKINLMEEQLKEEGISFNLGLRKERIFNSNNGHKVRMVFDESGYKVPMVFLPHLYKNKYNNINIYIYKQKLKTFHKISHYKNLYKRNRKVEKPQEKRETKVIDILFERFCEHWRNNVPPPFNLIRNRQDLFRVWRKQPMLTDQFNRIIKAIDEQVLERGLKRKYDMLVPEWPYPLGWLAKERWRDEVSLNEQDYADLVPDWKKEKMKETENREKIRDALGY